MLSEKISPDRKNLFDTAKNNFENIIKNKKIIMYGVGAIGATLFNNDIIPDIVIDEKFKSGEKYKNILCSSIEDITLIENKSDYIVIIAIRSKHVCENIFIRLTQLGFHCIEAIEFYESFSPFTSPEVKNDGFDYYIKNKDKILEAQKLFKDNLSLEIYEKFVSTHLERKFIEIPCNNIIYQYFDTPLNKGYNRVINCGSFDGDTIKKLNSIYGKIKAIACFEPDLKNYNLLLNYLTTHHDDIADEIITFPCGVYGENIKLNFSSEITTSSAITDKGNEIIQCIKLDNSLLGFNPSHIIMDIEGAELGALKGSENILKKDKPDLAICVYHLPNHIWDIPLYLNSLNLDYTFYLRNYTGYIYETVLYATV